MAILLGCIADDLTGATDLAATLARGGMRVVQVIGVPADAASLPAADAVVVALKSRTASKSRAITQSMDSANALLGAGARQLFFKYCSTFDSTDAGNIGPVTEALLLRTGNAFTIACPAFPANGRTVYRGHLFVGDRLLSESPLKDHPLTPMRDPNLVRVLQRQTRLPIGLIAHDEVDRGPEAIAAAFAAARAAGTRIAIVDALAERHLLDIGTAAAGLPLITGASGVAMGLPGNFRRQGLLGANDPSAAFTAPRGRAAILAGSCSAATRAQVAAAEAAGMPSLEVDPLALASGALTPAHIAEWARSRDTGGPVLVYSSAAPDAVERVQAQLGRDAAGSLVETTLAAVATALAGDGFTRLIVAGGETSGAVVEALGVAALEIGPEIDPGVPWTRALPGAGPRATDTAPMALALKSGNFGAPDFFLKAWELLS
jgi:uncharacterized protein YgbK (DUF1537 family)